MASASLSRCAKRKPRLRLLRLTQRLRKRCSERCNASNSEITMIKKSQIVRRASALVDQAGMPQLAEPMLSLISHRLNQVGEQVSVESAEALRAELQSASDVLAALRGYLSHRIASVSGLDVISTGGGLSAWIVTEADVPGYQVLITDDNDRAPKNPESARMTFGVEETEQGQGVSYVTLMGRQELNDWYEKHVGYKPDVDAGTPIPIEDLVKMVAGMMLHQFNTK